MKGCCSSDTPTRALQTRHVPSRQPPSSHTASLRLCQGVLEGQGSRWLPPSAAPGAQSQTGGQEGAGLRCNHGRGGKKEAPWQIEATSPSGWPVPKPSAAERAQTLPRQRSEGEVRAAHLAWSTHSTTFPKVPSPRLPTISSRREKRSGCEPRRPGESWGPAISQQ